MYMRIKLQYLKQFLKLLPPTLHPRKRQCMPSGTTYYNQSIMRISMHTMQMACTLGTLATRSNFQQCNRAHQDTKQILKILNWTRSKRRDIPNRNFIQDLHRTQIIIVFVLQVNEIAER